MEAAQSVVVAKTEAAGAEGRHVSTAPTTVAFPEADRVGTAR
jgi:hypothetical protein